MELITDNFDLCCEIKSFLIEDYVNVATISKSWKNVWGNSPRITRALYKNVSQKSLQHRFNEGLPRTFKVYFRIFDTQDKSLIDLIPWYSDQKRCLTPHSLCNSVKI